MRTPASGLVAFVLIAAAFSLPCAAQPAPVSHWRGEGNALDSVGPNNGEVQGAVTYEEGVVGQCFGIAGSGSISVASPVAGGLESPAGFTIAEWVLFDSFATTGPLMNLRTPANSSGFTLEHQFNTPGTLLFAVHVAGEFRLLSSPGWEPGHGYHVAATFDAATGSMRVYRDGLLVASRSDLPHTPMTTNPSSQFSMGRNIVNGATYSGLFDEVMFFNSPLADADIDCLVGPSRIDEDPSPNSVCRGGEAAFSITTRGTPPTSYRWQRGGTPLSDGPTGTGSVIAGAATSTLRIANASEADQGGYECTVTHPCGDVTTSGPAPLTICVADFNCSGGTPDDADISAFFDAWNNGEESADVNASGGTPDDADISYFFFRWNAGC